MFHNLTDPHCPEIEIYAIPALKDNYCYLLRKKANARALVIDPSEAAPIESALRHLRLQLTHVINTHHHHDHVGGNTELHRKYAAQVLCSARDIGRIPEAEIAISAIELIEIDGIKIQVLEIPGHTQGQIALYIADAAAVFVGDTMFAMGCGRLIEGTPEQMHQSLLRLTSLPAATRIFFGHEYTEKNSDFALSVNPHNSGVQKRQSLAREALEDGKIPAAPTVEEEKNVNPFLRLSDSEIRGKLGLESASDLEVFTELRKKRDVF